MKRQDRWTETFGMSRKRLRMFLYRRQSGRCGICMRPIRYRDIHSHKINVDHRRPLSHGGANEIYNLDLTHRPCNERKGDECPGCTTCEEVSPLWQARIKRKGKWENWGRAASYDLCEKLVQPLLLANPDLPYEIVRTARDK